jgi:hypothetical protein
MNKAISAACLMLCAGNAWAQSVIGRTVIDGQRVELLDNNTWRFAEAATSPAGCHDLREGVSFCGAPAQWQRITNAPPQLTAQYRFDDKTYGQFVIEGVGSSSGMNLAGIREMVIGYAAQASQVSPGNIPVLDTYAQIVDGLDGDTIVYGATISGMKFVFANTIVVEDARTIQAMTYTFGETYAEEHRNLHAEFIAEIRVAP